MQSPIVVHGLPLRKNPRSGQAEIFARYASSEKPRRLNAKLPTGYGKTIAAVGSYAILKASGDANRMLMVLPTDAQINQFKKDGPLDFKDVGIDDGEVIDIRFFGINALRKHQRNEAHVFAITVQSLTQPSGKAIVDDLLSKGRWFVVIDEYHHYGIDAAWGSAVKGLQCEYLLAMSATPYRPDRDSALGDPEVNVSYRRAAEEGAVKFLKGHSYRYRIDAVDDSGDIVSFTTDEIVEQAGGDSPEKIEKFRIERKMRWSPKYVSPLVTIPIERMMRERVRTGHKLQAIVGAMCVSHAEMISKQVSGMFPELSVDWVGTGPDGREDNDAIIAKFCPPKENGKRNPTLDVLVHVGMAGEGLDSVFVTEVIHLNAASINNSNNQENGRAARTFPGLDCVGHINFDSSSEYACKGYVGEAIMDAMDSVPPKPGDGGSSHEAEPGPLPVEPGICIWDITLESIDSGERMKMLEVAQEAGISGIDYSSLVSDKDMASPEWEKIDRLWHERNRREAEKFNSESIVRQWRAQVGEACVLVAKRAIKLMIGKGVFMDKSLIGDVKKRINRMKKIRCGEITEDIDVCKRHWKWLRELDEEIKESNELPTWLA